MITLTNEAVNQVQKVISEQTKGFAGLRVAVVGGGLLRLPIHHEPGAAEPRGR